MFELPESKRSIEQNQFAFKVGTKTYKMPRMKFLTTRIVDDLGDTRDPGKVLRYIAPDEKTADAILDLPIEHLEQLFEAWQKDSGVSLGESERSAD